MWKLQTRPHLAFNSSGATRIVHVTHASVKPRGASVTSRRVALQGPAVPGGCNPAAPRPAWRQGHGGSEAAARGRLQVRHGPERTALSGHRWRARPSGSRGPRGVLGPHPARLWLMSSARTAWVHETCTLLMPLFFLLVLLNSDLGTGTDNQKTVASNPLMPLGCRCTHKCDFFSNLCG